MAHFPLYIDLKDRLCLVAGGGKVAKRKIETLLKFGPRILVASLSFHEEIEAYAREGKLTLLPLSPKPVAVSPGPEQTGLMEGPDWAGKQEAAAKSMGPKQTGLMEETSLTGKQEVAAKSIDLELLERIEEAALVIAATSDHTLNRKIGLYCKERHILANVIDDAALCSFVFPSVVVRGDISIGINTGTNSPALSKQIRKQIEKAIPDSYQAIGEQLGSLRDYVKAHYEEEAVRRHIISQAAAKAFALDRPLSKEEIYEILVLTIDAS